MNINIDKAIKDNEVLIVQTTVGPKVANRLDKIKANDAAQMWRSGETGASWSTAGARSVGWESGSAGSAGRWRREHQH